MNEVILKFVIPAPQFSGGASFVPEVQGVKALSVKKRALYGVHMNQGYGDEGPTGFACTDYDALIQAPSRDDEGFVYVMAPIEGNGPVKIGVSRDPLARCRRISLQEKRKMRVVETFYCFDAYDVEDAAHTVLRSCRLPRSEWFECSAKEAAGAIETVL